MPKCNLRNLYLSYLLRICFLFEICAFRYTLLYPCPVVKTMDSLSAVNEAFSSSQHPAKQSPKGGKVWLPASSMYPRTWASPGSGKEDVPSEHREKSSVQLSYHKQASDSQGDF